MTAHKKRSFRIFLQLFCQLCKPLRPLLFPFIGQALPKAGAVFRLFGQVQRQLGALKARRTAGHGVGIQPQQLPLEQVKNELERVKQAGGNPKNIFLGDGNAFGLKTDHLLHILELVHSYFPDCQMVNMDATVTNIHQKSDVELRQLYDAGVRRLYLGIETGLDDVLRFMKKDHNLEQAYREIDRIQQAGMIFNAHMMTGIAGKGRSIENAEKTAEFFNRTHPERVINFSLFLHRRAPLYQEIEAGRFVPASERENLEEDRRLIELLETPGLVYDGFHDFLELRVRGTLPQDKEKMLAKIDQKLKECEGKPEVFAIVG